MKRDRIEKDLGVTEETSWEVVLGHVESFLRAGGIVTWEFWMRLGPSTRAAFLRARERIEAERATLYGVAAQSLDRSAEIMAVADQGALEIRMQLLRETERLRAQFSGGKGA